MRIAAQQEWLSLEQHRKQAELEERLVALRAYDEAGLEEEERALKQKVR